MTTEEKARAYAEDKAQLVGVMRSFNYHNGDVEIWLYDEFTENDNQR